MYKNRNGGEFMYFFNLGMVKPENFTNLNILDKLQVGFTVFLIIVILLFIGLAVIYKIGLPFTRYKSISENIISSVGIVFIISAVIMAFSFLNALIFIIAFIVIGYVLANYRRY